MSDSRDSSPDWLRQFQVPADNNDSPSSRRSNGISGSQCDGYDDDDDDDVVELKEASESKQQKNGDDDDHKIICIDSDGGSQEAVKEEFESPHKVIKVDNHYARRKKQDVKEEAGEVESKTGVDAEAKEEKQVDGAAVLGMKTAKGVTRTEFKLPLVMSDKIHRSKVLVECEGDALDMSGDVGAVGRVLISEMPSGSQEMLLDLKGTIYKTRIVPSRTFCIVNFGQTEAKVEAVINDFIQLQPHSTVFEAETMVEGTLDGFSFDSEEEGDRGPKGSTKTHKETIGDEQQLKEKTKRKANKFLGAAHKKGSAAKTSKRKARKPQATKKGKKK